jgi:hypothetical protein
MGFAARRSARPWLESPGTWEITVTMTGYTGTLGFEVLAEAP